jgi:hypothetical protein
MLVFKTMARLSEEKHPREGLMSPAQLRALAAQQTKEKVKARSQRDRVDRKEQLRAQLF